jgi:hypothetical protein
MPLSRILRSLLLAACGLDAILNSAPGFMGTPPVQYSIFFAVEIVIVDEKLFQLADKFLA